MGHRHGATLAFVLALTAPAAAQTPDVPWRTVRTAHHRLHYPRVAEAWAMEVARDLEGIRAAVADEVGWAPDRTVDVVIRDPWSLPNGMALPLRRRPRMELWATPPDAGSVIGHYDRWHRLLVVHEDTHLVHLLRPTRSPVERLLQDLGGIGPLAWKSPRWVVEGYATVVEGRLTGYGRPNGDHRALFLRTLAREGRLPTYDELDGSPRFAGGAYAYLVGSAFLEWLDAEAGGGRLPDLWARMSSRRIRSFDEAFEGVFGDDPVTLYGRFTARLTADAVALADALHGDRPWVDLDGAVSPPALSVDGGRVAAIVSSDPDRPASLVVWALAEDPEAIDAWHDDVAAMLEADPDDVAPRPPPTLGREEIARRTRAIPAASHPRFLPDGRVLFTGWQRDPTGRGRTDLYVWDPETGRERRITRRADLSDADPAPDGSRAVAVRSRYGVHDLVSVDLATGEVTPLTPGEVGVLYGSPRFHPDGSRIAVAVHRGAGWRVEIRDGATGAFHPVPIPPEATASFPSWTPDGDLLATVGRSGLLEAWRLPPDGPPALIASPPGGALGPVATTDGRILYASLHSDGVSLRAADPAASRPPPAPPPSLAVRPPPPTDVPDIAPASSLDVRPYGVGPLQLRATLGTIAAPGGRSSEAAVWLGDPVGRHEVLAVGTLAGTGGLDGGGIALESHALPVDVTIRGYAIRETAASRPASRGGGSAALSHTGILPAGSWQVGATALADVPLADDPDGSRIVGLLDGRVDLFGRRRGVLGASLSVAPRVGRTGGRAWWGAEGRVSLRAWRIALTGSGGTTTADSAIDGYRLGGLPGSALPAAYLLPRLHSGLFAPGTAAGTRHLTAGFRIGGPVALYGTRRLLASPGEAPVAATEVGISAALDVREVPLVGLPRMGLSVGIGTRLETPGDGWQGDAVTTLDGWGIWAATRWLPTSGR